jgi:hypothetical protein
MVVANEVEKRMALKPSVKNREDGLQRLRMMILIRRFEERTYQ